uniref:Translocon Sec61/SecY plug domain-containing protein n=1 Tax=Parascaris equorum TaxID=6256 RepID=A0A914RBP3_PAREQ
MLTLGSKRFLRKQWIFASGQTSVLSTIMQIVLMGTLPLRVQQLNEKSSTGRIPSASSKIFIKYICFLVGNSCS